MVLKIRILKTVVIIVIAFLVLVDAYLLTGNIILMLNSDKVPAPYYIKTDDRQMADKLLGIDAKIIFFDGFLPDRSRDKVLLIGVWVQDKFTFRRISEYIDVDIPRATRFIDMIYRSKYVRVNPYFLDWYFSGDR